ncbi:hypothetical protein ACWOBH_05370 [Globicatella sanguinis]
MLDKVKVGGIVYDIETVSDLHGRTGAWGEIQYKSALINLDDRMNKQIRDQTLIHEITHAMFNEAGMEQIERDVDMLGKVLYQVLLENDFSFMKNNQKTVTIYCDGEVDQVVIKDGE